MNPVYITKYALTSGIRKILPTRIGPSGTITFRPPAGHMFDQYYHLNEYSLDEAQARGCAEEMRTKRIAALKKQIARLEKLEIKIVEL